VAERTAPRNQKPPRDKARRKPGKKVGRNWRSRPLRNPPIRGRTNPEAHVTGSPGMGRTRPGNANREPGGERRCPSSANVKRGRHRNQPQAESRPTGGVSTREGGHSPAPRPEVATVSQRGRLIPAVSDHRKAAQRPRFRSRSTQGSQPVAE